MLRPPVVPHEEWLVGAEKTLRDLLLAGVDATMVEVDVDELEQWCLKNKLSINSDSCSTYVAKKLRLQYKS